MTTPPPALSAPLATHSPAREQIYRTLLADPAARWTVAGMTKKLPGISAEAVRTTLYLLHRDHILERVTGQRRLTFHLNDNGARSLHAVLNRWRGSISAPPPAPGEATMTRTCFQLAAAPPAAAVATTEDVRGRLLYLTRLEAVLTVQYRTGNSHRCTVVARRHPHPQTRHMLLSHTEIAAAPTTITIDADDVDAVAMAWLTEVWQRWRGGLVYLGARTLAEDLRIPGTLVADIDRHALVHLAAVTRLRAPGIGRLLERLSTGGLLVGAKPRLDGGWGSYALRLPALALSTDGAADLG